MSKSEQCSNCRFWQKFPDVSKLLNGECRIERPKVSVEPGNEAASAIWPTVEIDDWCGEWKGEGK